MSFHSKPAYQKWIMAVIIWPLEAAGLFILIGILRLLPRRLASFLMGWLLRKLGPLTRWHQRSHAHLLFALPHLSQTQARQILTDMWDNLGRNIGEYFHLKSLLKSPDLTISGLEHIDKKKGGFLITGHFGNWEITPLILSLTRIFFSKNLNSCVNGMWNRLRIYKEWTPNGLRMDSEWTPNGLRMDSEWTPNGLRMDSEWTQNGLQMDSE